MALARKLSLCLVLLLGVSLHAQTPFASGLRVLHVDPTRLSPGHFVYEAVLEHDITGTSIGTRSMTATRTTYGGVNAWLLVESKSSDMVPGLDSLFADLTTLRPMHWSSTIGRAHLGLEFRNDSAFGGATAPTGQRSVMAAVPSGAMVNAGMLEMVLRTLPLHPGWEDSTTTLSVSLAGVAAVPARLAVIGEDNVRVPAGQFDCWVVSVRTADTRGMYWVTKTDPIIVRSALDVPGLNGAQYVSSLTQVVR